MSAFTSSASKRRSSVVCAILLCCCTLAPPAHGAVPSKKLAEFAKFLGLQLVGWASGKVLDMATGLDGKKELEAMRTDLEQQIAGANGKELETLKLQLSVVQSQLTTLEALLDGKLEKRDVEALKRRLDADLPRIEQILHSHDQRIQENEEAIADLRSTLEALEARLRQPEVEGVVALSVAEVSVVGEAIPTSLAVATREMLLGELARDSRVRLGRDTASFDAVVDAKILLYEVIPRRVPPGDFGGYGHERRLVLDHMLEVALSLTDSTGNRVYWSKVFRRGDKEFRPPGAVYNPGDSRVAHELMKKAAIAGARCIVAYFFRKTQER